MHLKLVGWVGCAARLPNNYNIRSGSAGNKVTYVTSSVSTWLRHSYITWLVIFSHNDPVRKALSHYFISLQEDRILNLLNSLHQPSGCPLSKSSSKLSIPHLLHPASIWIITSTATFQWWKNIGDHKACKAALLPLERRTQAIMCRLRCFGRTWHRLKTWRMPRWWGKTSRIFPRSRHTVGLVLLLIRDSWQNRKPETIKG